MVGRIIVHSLRQVFGNMGGVLRVSGVLTLVQFAVLYYFGRVLFLEQELMQEMIGNGLFPLGQFLLVMVVQIILGLWIVVGWHRYVLLNEQPGIVPVPQPGRMLGYFGKSLLIGLLVVLVALIFSFVMTFLAYYVLASMGAPRLLYLIILLAVVYLPVAYVALRLSVSLPGAALEPGVPLFSGWEATKDASGTLVGLVIAGILAGVGLEYLQNVLFAADPFSSAALIFKLVTQWLFTMVGASVLTTLYGHYVEGRPLV